MVSFLIYSSASYLRGPLMMHFFSSHKTFKTSRLIPLDLLAAFDKYGIQVFLICWIAELWDHWPSTPLVQIIFKQQISANMLEINSQASHTLLVVSPRAVHYVLLFFSFSSATLKTLKIESSAMQTIVSVSCITCWENTLCSFTSTWSNKTSFLGWEMDA